MAEFMFQNVAYRATVYRTGITTINCGSKLCPGAWQHQNCRFYDSFHLTTKGAPREADSTIFFRNCKLCSAKSFSHLLSPLIFYQRFTGYFLSDQRNILTINPKYDNRLFDELHVLYVPFYIELF